MRLAPFPLTAATAVLALVQIGSTTASAATWRKCPDGTVVTDSQPCPYKLRLPSTLGGASQSFAPNSGGATKGKAPKPGDSTKDWRDYILGNPKPPIRPKP